MANWSIVEGSENSSVKGVERRDGVRKLFRRVHFLSVDEFRFVTIGPVRRTHKNSKGTKTKNQNTWNSSVFLLFLICRKTKNKSTINKRWIFFCFPPLQFLYQKVINKSLQVSLNTKTTKVKIVLTNFSKNQKEVMIYIEKMLEP